MFNPWYRLDEVINVTHGLMLRRAVAVFLADPYRWKLWTNPDLQSEVIWVQCRKNRDQRAAMVAAAVETLVDNYYADNNEIGV